MVCAKSQSVFLTRLPDLQKAARSAFRHLTGDRRDEAVQNVVTLVWKGYRALVVKGRADAADMLMSILFYAIRQTKCGRMIQGCPSAKDAFERKRRGEISFDLLDPDDFMGRSTPVLDAVSFRIDVPRFFDTLNERQQRMAHDLASGRTTSEVATLYGVTAGAVSQFRQRFKLLFDDFFAVA